MSINYNHAGTIMNEAKALGERMKEYNINDMNTFLLIKTIRKDCPTLSLKESVFVGKLIETIID